MGFSDVDYSERDRRVYTYLSRFIVRHSYAPSYRQIKAACGLSSTAQVKDCIERLSEAGRIEWQPGLARSIGLGPDARREVSAVVPRPRRETEGWA